MKLTKKQVAAIIKTQFEMIEHCIETNDLEHAKHRQRSYHVMMLTLCSSGLLASYSDNLLDKAYTKIAELVCNFEVYGKTA